MKLRFLLLLMMLSGTWLKATDTTSLHRHYREKPVWISMMDDSTANYFETIKAFNLYWQGRELPTETEGEANDLEKGEEEHLDLKDKSSYFMIYQYKRFKNWQRVMAYRINPQTGRILTQAELQKIWKTQTKGIQTNIE